MSTEWSNERLDRLATKVETLAANIADIIAGTGALLKAVEAQHHEYLGLQLEARRLVEELRQRRGVCNTYFDQVKENGKVDKTLTYEEAKLLKEQLGFPYYIKRIKVTKSRLGENSYEF